MKFERNQKCSSGPLQRHFSICQERATRTPTEDVEGARQHLPRDSGSIQWVPAAEKYVEITCCKSAK